MLIGSYVPSENLARKNGKNLQKVWMKQTELTSIAVGIWVEMWALNKILDKEFCLDPCQGPQSDFTGKASFYISKLEFQFAKKLFCLEGICSCCLSI